MTKKRLLIIFIKNEVKGKVKTRLAATLGDDHALEVYKALLDKTCEISNDLKAVTKRVYYSNIIEKNDRWDLPDYEKAVQHKGSLGDRMIDAFDKGFADGYDQICIIGSDCWDLTTTHLDSAFKALDHYDFVAGPANDGGYYLLGMNYLLESLFKNKTFSTDSVYAEALTEIKAVHQTVMELPMLTDIDNEQDLKQTSLWKALSINTST
ncbi:MAG: TIGR04282 family arsenosugar biosynthesis glycosyltransferase [Bacteroidota bacterium]